MISRQQPGTGTGVGEYCDRERGETGLFFFPHERGLLLGREEKEGQGEWKGKEGRERRDRSWHGLLKLQSPFPVIPPTRQHLLLPKEFSGTKHASI